MKSIGKNVATIGGAALTSAGIVGVGLGAFNAAHAVGIGKNQKTLDNEALGNVDSNGNRTAYVDRKGNLTTDSAKGATKQIIRNDTMAENSMKSGIPEY